MEGAAPPRFAQVAAVTTTDACYRALLDAGVGRVFEKVDVIDQLIHDDVGSFRDLEVIAATKLETALKEKRGAFDPRQRLIVFADHGFRLAPDGRRYTHGGPSALERTVPVWVFEPR